MATLNKMNCSFTNINSITLTNGLLLKSGQLAASGTVDGTIVSTTTLYTVPTGRQFLIQNIAIRILDNTGLTGTMVASIGTNAATYDNIMPSTTFTGFNALGEVWQYAVTGLSVYANSGDVVTINITTANGGTSVLYDVIMYGVII